MMVFEYVIMIFFFYFNQFIVAVKRKPPKLLKDRYTNGHASEDRISTQFSSRKNNKNKEGAHLDSFIFVLWLPFPIIAVIFTVMDLHWNVYLKYPGNCLSFTDLRSFFSPVPSSTWPQICIIFLKQIFLN